MVVASSMLGAASTAVHDGCAAAIASSAAAAFLGARIGTPGGAAIVRRLRRRNVEPA